MKQAVPFLEIEGDLHVFFKTLFKVIKISLCDALLETLQHRMKHSSRKCVVFFKKVFYTMYNALSTLSTPLYTWCTFYTIKGVLGRPHQALFMRKMTLIARK